MAGWPLECLMNVMLQVNKGLLLSYSAGHSGQDQPPVEGPLMHVCLWLLHLLKQESSICWPQLSADSSIVWGQFGGAGFVLCILGSDSSNPHLGITEWCYQTLNSVKEPGVK